MREAVDADMATIGKFRPPDGLLLLAFDGDVAVGTACLRRIGARTAEIKRMYVRPASRGGGLGRRLLDELVEAARRTGYERIRLDSPDFMTPAHGLYRSRGFAPIEAYAESEIPEEHRSHWVFMELVLG